MSNVSESWSVCFTLEYTFLIQKSALFPKYILLLYYVYYIMVYTMYYIFGLLLIDMNRIIYFHRKLFSNAFESLLNIN